MQKLKQTGVERLTEDDESRSLNPEFTAVEASGLHSTLEDAADTFDVTGFKCAKCGLVHQHDSTKHRLSDTFDVGSDIGGQTDFSPVCHCGAQEASRNGSQYGIDESRAANIASGAPIPAEEARAMDKAYGPSA